MYGDHAHVRDPEARRVPFPPVTTRWIPMENYDPGTMGRRLPPFWGAAPEPASAVRAGQIPQPAAVEEAPRIVEPESTYEVVDERSDEAEIIEAEVLETGAPEPEAEPLPWEVMLEPEEPAALVPDLELVIDVEEIAAALPDLDFVDEAAPADVRELELQLEEAQEIAEDAAEEQVVPIGDLVEEPDWSTTSAAVDEEEILEEPVTAQAGQEAATEELILGPPPDEQPWEAFGRALQEAVSFADLAAEETEPSAVWSAPERLEEDQAAEPWEQDELVGVEEGVAETVGAAEPTKPEGAETSDPFVQDVAEHLQSLVDRLRAQGMRALGDAIAEGDRLEASLALFLAGYRAGRGE